MARVINAADIERAVQFGRKELVVEPGSVVPTVARQRAEQLGIKIVYGTNGAGTATAAPPPPAAPQAPANGNGGFRIEVPGGRATAILPDPVPVVQPPNAPSTVFRTPPDAPIAPRFQPPAAPAAPAPARPPASVAPPAAPAPSAPAAGRPDRVEYPPPAQLQGKYEIDIKPNYFATPGMDNIYHIAMELGAALWVVKDRLKVVEEILENKGILTEEEIELYKRSPEARQANIKKRQAFIDQIYGILKANPQ